MKRYHVSGKPRGFADVNEESASKRARNRERIAAANAKRAKPKTKKQYGVSNDPKLMQRTPDRAESLKPGDSHSYLLHASEATRGVVARKIKRETKETK